MKAKQNYYRVAYCWPGGAGSSVTDGATAAEGWRNFASKNPHVTVTRVEACAGGEVLTELKAD